jgi:DNA-binding Lrp family transcriptional regulator
MSEQRTEIHQHHGRTNSSTRNNGLKDVELRLISELMRNSRGSDRELARAIGASQKTVTRIRSRLEKEGYLLEYTAIPNFSRIGYHLCALTFFKWNKNLSPKEVEEARTKTLENSPSVPSNIVLIERGIGLNYDSMMMSFHKDYSSYDELMKRVKTNPYLGDLQMESFIVDLDDSIQYRYLTFSILGKHLLETMAEPKL